MGKKFMRRPPGIKLTNFKWFAKVSEDAKAHCSHTIFWAECVCLRKWHQYIFSVCLKFGAYYSHGWVGRVYKKCYLMLLYTFFAFFCCFSSKNLCFYHFHFFFWWSIKFLQQNINQWEMWIDGFQLLVELYVCELFCHLFWHLLNQKKKLPKK